jgi:hypothetical protein
MLPPRQHHRKARTPEYPRCTNDAKTTPVNGNPAGSGRQQAPALVATRRNPAGSGGASTVGVWGVAPQNKELDDPGPRFPRTGIAQSSSANIRVTKRATVSYLPGLGVRRPGTQSLDDMPPAACCAWVLRCSRTESYRGGARLLFAMSLADQESAPTFYAVREVTSRAHMGAPLQSPQEVPGHAE